MSHAVAPDDLATTAEPYGSTPFLLYSAIDGSARVNHVTCHVETEPAIVRVQGFGRGVAARLADGVQLSLLWPAREAGTFSLIADGFGSIDESGEILSLTITGAVLHRPAPLDGTTSC